MESSDGQRWPARLIYIYPCPEGEGGRSKWTTALTRAGSGAPRMGYDATGSGIITAAPCGGRGLAQHRPVELCRDTAQPAVVRLDRTVEPHRVLEHDLTGRLHGLCGGIHGRWHPRQDERLPRVAPIPQGRTEVPASRAARTGRRPAAPRARPTQAARHGSWSRFGPTSRNIKSRSPARHTRR